MPGEESKESNLQLDSSSSDEDGLLPVDDDLDFDELHLDDDELFAAPGSNFNYDIDEEINVNINNLWILLWIFKYQERFRLSDVAINSLVGFLSLVLKDISLTQFKDFPPIAYMARKLLDIKKN